MKTKFLVVVLLVMFLITSSFLPTHANESLDVVYFYSSKCMACKENASFIDKLAKVDGVNLIKYNTDEADCSSMQSAYAEHFGVAEEKSVIVPYIYFGTKAYELSPELHSQVLSEVDDYVSGKVPYENFKYDNGSCNISPFEKFLDKMTVPSILLAGLIDGINPCAISILMVFYSFLMITENKKKIVLMSSLFISGIFLANFVFGLGFKMFYNALAGNLVVMYTLYGCAILMCIAAIILNTIDIINHKKEIVKNQLPDTIKYKMVNLLRKNVFSKFAIIASLGVGFVIGAVELACTGQIYFPTLTYMIQSTNYGPKSIVLLVLYNIMFVLPLIIITVVAGCIKQPEQIKGIVMKKNWLIKLIANIFFIIMTVILLKQIFII